MRLLIAGDFRWNNGSSHVIREYARHAAALGMEIAVSTEFGSHDEPITCELPYCSDLRWATHILVVFESNPFLSTEDLELIDRAIPRARRAVVDADGHWSPETLVGSDDNNWPCGQEAWRRQMLDVADLILQPALITPGPGAVQFPYFGIPESASPVTAEYIPKVHMQYIGSNWFRFAALQEVFGAVRAALGEEARLRVCGTFWDGSVRAGFEAGTRADQVILGQLCVDVQPPVPFGQVVQRMGDATVTPVLVRPVLARLGFLTPRMFETVAASTIPVYRLSDAYIGQLYQDNSNFCLGEDPVAKIKEIFDDQPRFRYAAKELYFHLYKDYSYPAVLRRLYDLLD